jgi:nucleoid-associated protein YgaU
MMLHDTLRAEGQARVAVRLVAWVTFLLVVALPMGGLRRGVLAPPSLTEPGSWAGWVSGRTPVEAAFAVLGLAMTILAWYLLVATVLVAAAQLGRAGRLVSVAEVLTLPVVRRAVHAMLGLGLASSSVAGLAVASAGPPSGGSTWLAPAGGDLVVAFAPGGEPQPGEPARSEGRCADDADSADGAPVMRRLPAEGAGDEAGEDATVMPATEPEVWSGEWKVEAGDHLWSMATQVLERTVGHPSSDDEVATYWRRLVEANLDRLADPANPDLIFPGQVLAVPDPSP